MHTSILYRQQDGMPVDAYVIESARELGTADLEKLSYLLKGRGFSISGVVPDLSGYATIGPRLAFSTPESGNGMAILNSIEVPVTRIERFAHYPTAADAREDILARHFDRMTQAVYTTLPANLTGVRGREPLVRVPTLSEGAAAIAHANARHRIGLTAAQQKLYADLFIKIGRDPTLEELFFLPSFNSDHSRHLKFNARIVIDEKVMPYTLFDLVKAAHKHNPGISTVAFSDNASAQYGAAPVPLFLPRNPGGPSPVCFVVDEVTGQVVRHTLQITGKVETHNFPTSIVPFAGAATGVGGLLRDLYAMGRGGYPGVALWTGLLVGGLNINGHAIPGETVGPRDETIADPLRIFLEGMEGACDYANASGHPVILWLLRSFEQVMPWGDRIGFRKPGMFAGGLGRVHGMHTKKMPLGVGMLAIRFGGPTFNLGFGGATASSVDQSASSATLNYEAVQRGDPEMGCRTFRVMNAAVARLKRNPFRDLHDQGAGGVANLFAELVARLGATLDLGKLNLGDPSIKRIEKLLGESQEGFGAAIAAEDLAVLSEICDRERVPLEVLGVIDGEGVVRFVDSTDGTMPIDLRPQELRDAVGELTIEDTTVPRAFRAVRIPEGMTTASALRNILRLPGVGSDRWATTRGDSSVGGKVAQSHTCGPMLVPVAQVGVTADSHFAVAGAAMAVGVNYAGMLIDPEAGARMTFADMYLKFGAAAITGAQDICIQGNWTWPASIAGEMARLYRAAESLRNVLLSTASRLTGGKDSLSMSVKIAGSVIASPGTLVLTGYAPVSDIRNVRTPAIPRHERIVSIGFVDLSGGKNRLGGSAFAQTLGQLGDQGPDIEDPALLRQALEAMQVLHTRKQVLAYHARTSGGLAAALARMCMASGYGMQVTLPAGSDPVPYLFNEEAGYVFAYDGGDEITKAVTSLFATLDVPFYVLGGAAPALTNLSIRCDTRAVLNEPVATLRSWYEATSDALSELRGNPEAAREEARGHAKSAPVRYRFTFKPTRMQTIGTLDASALKAAVLREEGANGHEEMWAALRLAGFEPYDIHMSDLIKGKVSSLDPFKLLASPGGFSYKDFAGAGRGQAAVVHFNDAVRGTLKRFFARPDTLSLGVCNGNQFKQQLWVLPGSDRPEEQRPYLGRNTSKRFESRWSLLRIYESPASLTFFGGMEGSVLGIHTAHGEGRYVFPDQRVLDEVLREKLAPLRFVGADHEPTEEYPHNPNGSPFGIAGLCSPDGRHVGMMPHPERAVLSWQWVYRPEDWDADTTAHWLRMFENAYRWCCAH